MKNKKIIYIIIGVIVLIGGYFVFSNNTISPKSEVRHFGTPGSRNDV